MDMDFWASRLHSAKHHSSLQPAGLRKSDDNNHLIMDDTEGDDDMRAWFPCPFCYVEIQVPVLCSHLQEEHCFDLKNAVCPICAANLGKDAIGHFTVQHAYSIKRRKSQKSGFWSNNPINIGNDLRELSLFLGPYTRNGRCNVHETAPDPLLSPFICNISVSDPKDTLLQDEISSNAGSSMCESTRSSMLDEVQEQDYEEKRLRAAFFQEMILSTIF